jgi:hypothetical protein
MRNSGWFFWPLAALLARYRAVGYAPRSRLASGQNPCAIVGRQNPEAPVLQLKSLKQRVRLEEVKIWMREAQRRRH